jgi:poly-gamma-glutamate capsule biosynthesis protein CapA/YwtB (metallophosphatase superfamily)
MAEQVTLLAVGDVAPRISAPETQLAGIAPLLRAADIAFGQLETPLTNEGTRQLFPGFRGSSGNAARDGDATAAVLADSGFTVMSFAGNHTMDRSAEAMLASVTAAEARGVQLVGAGENLDAARQPVIVPIPDGAGGGTTVGFLAYCSVLPRGFDATRMRAGVAPLRARTFYEQVDWQAGTPPRIVTMTNSGDLAALRADVRQLREQVDVVVVSMHWGIHFEPGSIADYQYEAAHAAIDEGADVILGHHGHVIKGIEYYKDKPIFYSLGNVTLLPRGDKGEPLTEDGRVDAQMTMIAKLTIEGGKVNRVAVIPCWLDLSLEPEVIPPDDPRFARFLAYLRRVNDIPSTPRNSWDRMYLPPVDESWALRDTHFTADGGEIVATYSAGVHDKTPWTPRPPTESPEPAGQGR